MNFPCRLSFGKSQLTLGCHFCFFPGNRRRKWSDVVGTLSEDGTVFSLSHPPRPPNYEAQVSMFFGLEFVSLVLDKIWGCYLRHPVASALPLAHPELAGVAFVAASV